MYKKSAASPLKQILSLQKLRAQNDEVAEIYPRAYALPSFFSHNLISPRRVVKYFQGPLAIVGAFYYQLMKLALQLQPQEVNHRDIIFRKFVQFQLFGEGELEDDLFSDFQYRKFFKDFIQIVESQDVPSFQKTAELYPIIDEILIKYFKIILPMPLLMDLEHTTSRSMNLARHVLTFLCEQFKITLSQIGPCFKFEQSDTFLYFQNIHQVFLAFNETIVQSIEETESSEFTQTFKCGEDNSFMTKYHTQTIPPPQSIQDKQDKKSIMLIDTKENLIHHPSSISGNFKKLFKTAMTEYSDEKWSHSPAESLPPSRQEKPFSAQPLTALLNKDVRPTSNHLYSQFTDSFLLKEMPTLYRDGVRNIKNKYRSEKRSSIRTFF